MGALLARGPTWSSHWLSSSWQPLCWQSQSPLLKLLLLQRPRLIPTFCMEATMDIHMHMEDIMDIWDMDIGAEREDQLKQSLLLNLKLIPKADPYLLYGGYYGHGLGYYGYPYAYGHLGYWGRKRRSAEPEPA